MPFFTCTTQINSIVHFTEHNKLWWCKIAASARSHSTLWFQMVLHTDWNNHPYPIKRNLQAKLGSCKKGFQFREDGYLECSSGDAKQVMPCILSRCYVWQVCYRRDKAPCRRSDILATLYVLKKNHTTIIEDQGTKWFSRDKQKI